MTAPRDPPSLSRGRGSLVFTEDGGTLVDIALGFGAAFLGHAHPVVTASLQRQAGELLSCGRNATPARARVDALVSSLLPPGMRVGGICSTGMEVAEFAMRVAASHTGRRGFAGFARSMHGKSAMTAGLCWQNAALRPENLHTLPFVEDAEEPQILEALDRLLRTRGIAALFVEPIQGSNGAREASIDFYQQAIALCRESGTLCVFDEILTGLFRTGTRFYSDRLREPPDMLLFAKCLGNGFPVSAIAVGEQVAILPGSSPGSTFSGNSLALAAIEGTLEAMGGLDMARRVAAIESTVLAVLGQAHREGATLRGRGALWCLEIDGRIGLDRALGGIRDAGVLVTSAANFIRLLPAATIDLEQLEASCQKIARACAAARQ
jgi:acetylornithine/LysW-gamma-L-lysine aminotransferase